MEIIWTEQALNSVNKIVDYIAQDNPQAAKKWARKLLAETDQLMEQPRSGRVVPEYDEDTLRELIAGNYRIIYRIKAPIIYIQTVWHVRQLAPDSTKGLDKD